MKFDKSSVADNVTEDIFLSEEVVLLDDALNPIGSAPKLETHHSNTPLHLAFSVYIFNEQNELLITKRATDKKVWPGVWTNSCCGHPAPEETLTDAIKRRTMYELGIELSDIIEILPNYRYISPPYFGIIENEYCPVYFARTTFQPRPNIKEVQDLEWVTWQEYVNRATADIEDTWSWWCKDQLKLLVASNKTLNFIKTNL